MKKNRWIAAILVMVMALAAFGCKTDTDIEIELKDKTYCSAVTFTSEATADGVKVTMATTTEGAVIYYTTDGTLPTEKSTKYSEAIEFTQDATIKAIAIKEGIENSPVSVATVSIKEKTITETKIEYVDKTYCSAVTFTSEATADGVKVTMATMTEGAVIYYTTDGTLPTKESTKYSESVEFKQDATVKAIAIKEGIENSPVSVATVSIKEKTITETKIEYVDKTYCSAVTFTSKATADGVKIIMATTTEGAVIYYTTDGTLPTKKSTKYSETVEFTQDATVKAIAIKEGIENSPVSIASVSIKEKTITETKIEYVDKNYCSAVTFTSEATADGVKVTMATTTEGAVIYYTTDGTLPTKESTEYSEAVEFTKDATLKAIAIKEGIENSPVSVAMVSIKEKTIIVDKKADETAPASVTELTAQAKDSRILLTWKDAADSDIYGYEVSYSGTKPINRVVLPALDTTSMMVPPKAEGTYVNGLTNGTEYTFTVKTVDISGNKSEGVTVKGTPVAIDTGETLKIALTASVPQENGYTGNKSNTKVTVKANITTASNVKKVVWKKDGSLIAKTLLADENAADATKTEDNAVWTFDITAQGESANGAYTVAAIDEAGREEAQQITIDNFDFTPPAKVKGTNAVYSSELSSIIINWTEPGDADYHHVDITFTTNDGTNNSEPSQAITVNKGTLNKTFSDIESTKAYYTYTFVTYDELGNKGAEYIHKVPVNSSLKVDYTNCVVGDFILKDGTILSKDETPESDTVAAVIVRAATNDKPALGVGIVHNKKTAWCTTSAAGYNTNIYALQGAPTRGYTDGSDGWKKLKAACSDAENNPENYPAWNYSLTYAKNNSLNGDLATGWYLPTLAELYTIYQNKAVVNASLSKAGGRQFDTSYYWSCCQDTSRNNDAQVLYFLNGTIYNDVKYSYSNYVCSVRAFN